MAKVIGDAALNAKLRRLAKGVDVTQALLRGAEKARAHYVEAIMDNADGRPDVRYNPRREVRVSLPGQAPNTDTGVLVASSGVQSEHRNQAEVFATADYAEDLEFGTEKMAPRPAMGPAYDATRDDVLAEVVRAIKASEKRS